MSIVQLTNNAWDVLEARYLRRGDEREIVKSTEALFQRVARAIAEAELAFSPAHAPASWEARFLELLVSLEFFPNSPTLMNAGTGGGQLSACFVLPVEDALRSIPAMGPG